MGRPGSRLAGAEGQHGFCITPISVGGKKVNGCNKSSCLRGYGPLAPLVGHLLSFRLEGSSGLLSCGYCLVIGTGGSVAPPDMMLAGAPEGQVESKYVDMIYAVTMSKQKHCLGGYKNLYNVSAGKVIRCVIEARVKVCA